MLAVRRICSQVLRLAIGKAVKLDDPFVLQAGLGAPLIFKDNAVYDFLEDADIKVYRKGVPGFIRRLLELGGVAN